MKDQGITIIVAEDDDDDFLLLEEALRSSLITNNVIRCDDGQALMDFLLGEGRDLLPPKRAALILLDLNMPRMDGREALALIKANKKLRQIPVVIFTTSQAQEDIIRSYDLGVSSFIRKPVQFDDFVDVLKVFNRYWFEIVELPK